MNLTEHFNSFVSHLKRIIPAEQASKITDEMSPAEVNTFLADLPSFEDTLGEVNKGAFEKLQSDFSEVSTRLGSLETALGEGFNAEDLATNDSVNKSIDLKLEDYATTELVTTSVDEVKSELSGEISKTKVKTTKKPDKVDKVPEIDLDDSDDDDKEELVVQGDWASFVNGNVAKQ